MKRAACCRPIKRQPSTSTINRRRRPSCTFLPGQRSTLTKSNNFNFKFCRNEIFCFSKFQFPKNALCIFLQAVWYQKYIFCFFYLINFVHWRSTLTPQLFSRSTLTILLFSIWSTSTTAFFYWLISTILLFSTWSTVDARRQPFYSPFHHALIFPQPNQNKNSISYFRSFYLNSLIRHQHIMIVQWSLKWFNFYI